MKETPYSPEWWASFFEWDFDRVVQLEFVNEAMMATFSLETNKAEDVAMDATAAWMDEQRVHVVAERLALHDMAMLLASFEVSVIEEAPLKVQLRDATDGSSCTPMILPAYTAEQLRAELAAAESVLDAQFPWIAGWRLIALSPPKAEKEDRVPRHSKPGVN